MRMNLRRSLVAVLMSFSVLACGGSDNNDYTNPDIGDSGRDDDSTENTPELSFYSHIVNGKVNYFGYVENAKVCISLNNSSQCDTHTVLTDTEGYYEIEFESHSKYPDYIVHASFYSTNESTYQVDELLKNDGVIRLSSRGYHNGEVNLLTTFEFNEILKAENPSDQYEVASFSAFFLHSAFDLDNISSTYADALNGDYFFELVLFYIHLEEIVNATNRIPLLAPILAVMIKNEIEDRRYQDSFWNQLVDLIPTKEESVELISHFLKILGLNDYDFDTEISREELMHVGNSLASREWDSNEIIFMHNNLRMQSGRDRYIMLADSLRDSLLAPITYANDEICWNTNHLSWQSTRPTGSGATDYFPRYTSPEVLSENRIQMLDEITGLNLVFEIQKIPSDSDWFSYFVKNISSSMKLDEVMWPENMYRFSTVSPLNDAVCLSEGMYKRNLAGLSLSELTGDDIVRIMDPKIYNSGRFISDEDNQRIIYTDSAAVYEWEVVQKNNQVEQIRFNTIYSPPFETFPSGLFLYMPYGSFGYTHYLVEYNGYMYLRSEYNSEVQNSLNIMGIKFILEPELADEILNHFDVSY